MQILVLVERDEDRGGEIDSACSARARAPTILTSPSRFRPRAASWLRGRQRPLSDGSTRTTSKGFHRAAGHIVQRGPRGQIE